VLEFSQVAARWYLSEFELEQLCRKKRAHPVKDLKTRTRVHNSTSKAPFVLFIVHHHLSEAAPLSKFVRSVPHTMLGFSQVAAGLVNSVRNELDAGLYNIQRIHLNIGLSVNSPSLNSASLFCIVLMARFPALFCAVLVATTSARAVAVSSGFFIFNTHY
jgi:hypothetical protein